MNLPLPTDLFALFLHISVFAAFGALSLIAHEAGHYHAIKSFGGKPKITYWKGDLVVTGLSGLPKDKQIGVYWTGIIAGLAALYPAMLLLFPPFSVGLLIAYFAGSKHDFKELARLVK